MSEPKWTKGEWMLPHLADDNSQCNCGYVLSEGYFGAIATVHVDNGKCVSQGGNDCPPLDEAKANALLISAAPSLYWALEDLLDVGGEPEKVARARAAIAKARGETR